MEQEKQSYTSPAYWIDMLFQKGVLIVAEVFGVLFLLRALTSSEFNSEAAIIGTILVVIGVAFEYLVWIKKSSFLSQRIEVLEEKSKKVDDRIIQLIGKFLESAPSTSGTKES